MWGSGEVLVQGLTSFQESGKCFVYVHAATSRTSNNFETKNEHEVVDIVRFSTYFI